MVYKFFNERTKGLGIESGNRFPENKQLAEELHKPIIKNFKRRKVYSSFKDNIWDVDLADMQLISKYNKEIRYLLCVIDFLVDMLGLFLWKIKKEKVLLKGLKRYWMILIENQIKYG